jgi:hypothetical protein
MEKKLETFRVNPFNDLLSDYEFMPVRLRQPDQSPVDDILQQLHRLQESSKSTGNSF